MPIEGRLKLGVGGAALLASVALCSNSPGVWSGRTAPAAAQEQRPTDPAKSLPLTPIERESIKREMRTMLRSLSMILHGLEAGDLEKVEDAARSSGIAAALQSDVTRRLPPHFVELDMRIHTRFEQLADGIKAGGRGAVSKRLAALTGYCVACHEMYRVEERR